MHCSLDKAGRAVSMEHILGEGPLASEIGLGQTLGPKLCRSRCQAEVAVLGQTDQWLDSDQEAE